LETLKKLNKKEKKTIILVTHDLNLVKYARKVIKLRDGMVVSK